MTLRHMRTRRMRFLATATLGALLAAGGGTSTARAADVAPGEWPQWRGPGRDNISPETGLLKEWPKDGPPLAWKATGIGAGYSSVSIANGHLFTMGDAADASYVYCLTLDGKPAWRAKVGRTGGGGGYPGPRCTPTVDGQSVYALGQYGDLVCLDAASGKERWRTNLEKDQGGEMMSGWGYAESPLVDGDKLICTPGGGKGTLLALDKNTGKPLWRTTDWKDAAAYSSVVIGEIGGKRQYVQLTGESVAGVDPDTGKVLWRAPRKGATAVIPTPLVRGNDVFVTSGYGVGCNLFSVTPGGGALAAKQVYANKNMQNHLGGVVLVGEHVYGSSDPGILVCMELKSGKVAWKDRSVGKGAVSYADGHLYLRKDGGPGTVALVEATPAGYREKSTFEQPDRSDKNSWPQPVIAGGKMYLRDQDLLLCYDVKAK